MRKNRTVGLVVILLPLFGAVGMGACSGSESPNAAALTQAESESAGIKFASPLFADIWNCVDGDGARGNLSWTFGDTSLWSGKEMFDGAPRVAQYFDKARMELDSRIPGPSVADVTFGLLVVELISGKMQTGTASFEARQPAKFPLAGDAVADNPSPSYATLNPYASISSDVNPSRRKAPASGLIVNHLAKDGTLVESDMNNYGTYNLTYGTYSEGLGHNIAKAFEDYIVTSNSRISVAVGSQKDVFGLPISEPYWIDIRVAGATKSVLFQAFERRALTYSPDNAEGWQVEMGNVGKAYVEWKNAAPPAQDSGKSVLTQRNDNNRSGWFSNERILKPGNVAADKFGKLFERAVDGYLYAQPLYVSDIDIGGKRRNVVYLATEHNSVYAYDADDPNANGPLWQVSVGPSMPSDDIRDLPSRPDFRCNDLTPEVGITATPVIDLENKTIYVSAKIKENDAVRYTVTALDISTGARKDSVNVNAEVPATGNGSVNGKLKFDPVLQLNRPGLLLVKGADKNHIYLAFGSHCDIGAYHGWVIGYDAQSLGSPALAYVDTPGSWNGGIWQAGGGLAADESGNIYVMSGNGGVDGDTNRGNSFIKLSPELKVLDWFTPGNYQALNDTDMDLGSSGVLLIPGTNQVIGGGKEGRFYVLDRSNLGHIGNPAQSFAATGGHIHGSPTYYKGPGNPSIYVWSEKDQLKHFEMVDGQVTPAPKTVSKVAINQGMPGGMLSVSSSGAEAGTGILWATYPLDDGAQKTVPGVLRAFDANDVGRQIWSSESDADNLGNFAKFSAPTVANGKVYVSTFSGKLVVYGPK